LVCEVISSSVDGQLISPARKIKDAVLHSYWFSGIMLAGRHRIGIGCIDILFQFLVGLVDHQFWFPI
jgi:hypothetical protein